MVMDMSVGALQFEFVGLGLKNHLSAIILGKVLDCFEPQCPHLYDEKINAYTVKIYANLLN